MKICSTSFDPEDIKTRGILPIYSSINKGQRKLSLQIETYLYVLEKALEGLFENNVFDTSETGQV